MKLRQLLVLIAPLLCLLPAQPARADTLGTGSIDVTVWLKNDQGTFVEPIPQAVIEFFNRAHCLCPDETFAARFQLMNEQASQDACIVQLWVGPGCPDAVDSVNREATCVRPNELISTQPAEFSDVRDLRSPQNVELPVVAIASPSDLSCAGAENSASIYALIDDGNANDTVWNYNSSIQVSFDTLAPPEPHNPIARRGENAAVLSWDAPTSRQEDIQFYQVLCARVDGTINAADKFGEDDPQWQTSNDLCGVEDSTVVVHLPTSTGEPTGTDADAGTAAALGPGVDAMVNDASMPDASVTPDAMTNDAGTSVGLPESLANLDPSTICGTTAAPANGIRVNGLENNVTYRIVLVSIDLALNATAIDLGEVTPKPVADFWEDYKDQGGTAEGGFCLANATYGGNHPFTNVLRDFRDDVLASTGLGQAFIAWYYANVAPLGAHVQGSLALRIVVGILLLPLVAVAAFFVLFGWFGIALLMGLYWWRKRRRRTANGGPTSSGPSSLGTPRRKRAPMLAPAFAGAAALAVIMLSSPIDASAQKYDPYWEHFEDEDTGVGIGHSKWVFELKFGPYLPQIDSDFSADVGPFENTFGGDASIMGILELDRFFAWPMGQLGIATSIGYVSRTAGAFEIDAMGGRTQSETEETSFNLMPVSVGAVYRYTDLDDKYGIPIIPYGKLGLSYYIWWIGAPDGSLAEVPNSDCPSVPSNECTGELGRGASLGFQASFGLSLRAERLDKNSAASLRNELGIAHAGFFVEMTYASVNGFGNDKKLNVGDLTWFAGLNFEF